MNSDTNRQNNHDDTLQAINQILPQIQQEITQQMRLQIQQQMNKQLYQQIKCIQIQAQEQYMEAIHVLNQQRQKLQQQKIAPYYLKIVDIQTEAKQKDKKEISQLQDKFLLTYFDTKVLKHPKIQKLQIQIQQQLFDKENIANKFEQNKLRKLKQISVQIEQKQQKYKRQKDKTIRKNQFSQSGIQQLKKDIEVFSVRIAQLKSQYNIKIRKIDNDIKTDKKKIKQFTNNQNIHQLRNKLQQLEKVKLQKQLLKKINVKGVKQVQISSQQQSQNSNYKYQQQNQNQYQNDIHTSLSNGNYNDSIEYSVSANNFQTFNKQNKKLPQEKKIKGLTRTQKDQILQSLSMSSNSRINNNQQSHYAQDQIVIQSSSEEQNFNENICLNKNKKQKQNNLSPTLKRNSNFTKIQTLNPPQNKFSNRQSNFYTQNSQQEDSQTTISNGPIINFDVSKLLRQKWEDDSIFDPLGKYLSHGSINDQNNSKLSNCQNSSDFYQQYQNHLKKLGGVSKNSYEYIESQKGKQKYMMGMKKISKQGKQFIMKTLVTSGLMNR